MDSQVTQRRLREVKQKKVRWEDCKMVTISDKETEDKPSKLSEQHEDASVEKKEKDHQEPEISQ